MSKENTNQEVNEKEVVDPKTTTEETTTEENAEPVVTEETIDTQEPVVTEEDEDSEPVQNGSEAQVMVNVPVLNVRSKSDVKAKIKTTVRDGEVLTVLKQAGKWIQVQTPSKHKGFVMREFVEEV